MRHHLILMSCMVVSVWMLASCMGGASVGIQQVSDGNSMRGCVATLAVDSRLGVGDRLEHLTDYGCLPAPTLQLPEPNASNE